MNPTQITDHVALALDRLPERYKGKPRIEALLRSWVAPAQALEAAFFQLYYDRWLDTAVGAQLDGIGDILQRPRSEVDDIRYRIVLKAQIFALFRAIGSPDDYHELLSILETEGVDHQLLETYPAENVLVLDEIPITPHDLLWEMLNLIRCLGIRLVLEYTTEEPDESFAFSDDDTHQASSFGFADTETDPGGTFAWSIADSDKGLDQ